MALGSCYSCIKYLMFAFNFIFWVLGCAILGVGIWLRVDEGASEYAMMSSLYTAAYILIVLGFFIMVVGFLGCCGAIRESQCMLATFFLALLIIFAVLLGAGIWFVVAKGSVEDMVVDWLDTGVKEYYTDDDKQSTMDNIQAYFQCCGSTIGGSEYDYSNKDPPCHPNDTDKPCFKELSAWWEDKLVVAAGVCIGIALIMILGMIFSMVLCCAVRDTMA